MMRVWVSAPLCLHIWLSSCFTCWPEIWIAPGYIGFFQFLRNFAQLTAFEQAEMILYAALDPAMASKSRKGDFVRCLDHFDLLQSPIN
jgi:hypothetical protein